MIRNNGSSPKKLTTAEIVSKTRVAVSHFQMKLNCPYIALNTVPGQFVQVRINSLSYDPFLCRPLAIYRTKGNIIDIMFKVVGKGTKLLSEKAIGDTLDIMGPLGNGFPLDGNFHTAILVAGGMGIAALMALAENLKNHRIIALIGASTHDKIIGDKHLIDLGAEVHISTEDGSAGYKGLVSQLLEEILPKELTKKNRLFACGPTLMLKSIAYISEKYNIEAYVSLEERMACGVGACLGCAVEVVSPDGGTQYKMVCSDGPVFDAQEILWK